jgi:hypothetical protein
MAKRKAKLIEDPEVLNEILSLTHHDACRKSFIMDWFGDYGEGPRFNPYDTFEVPKGGYSLVSYQPDQTPADSSVDPKPNKQKFITTLGLWVFNKSFLEPVSAITGYINHTVDGDEYSSINKQLSYALMEEKITVDQLKEFIMQSQILMTCTAAICPSHTEAMLLFTDKVNKKKEELEKKYKKDLDNVNLTTIKNIEDELIKYAKDQLKDEESVDMYNSGARGSWGNNFKNMYIMKGPIRKTDGTYDYIGTSYIEGLSPKDFAKENDSAVGGPYSRSRETQYGGYDEKLFTRATQHIVILPKGSDCGTSRTIKVHLNAKNISQWMYSYVKQGNNLIEITSDTYKDFIGKTVNMRFSSLCESKNGICEHCAGTMFRRAGVKNAGLLSMVMMSSVKNRAMKAFHDSTLNLTHIDAEAAFGLK